MWKLLLAAASALALTSTSAGAATIVSAVSATSSSEFSATFDIGNAIDQSGLAFGYTSGVTDFDAYLALDPKHSSIAADQEWFSPANVLSATLTFDLGSVLNIDRLAIWNEEASGFGRGVVSSSIDGVTFALLTTIFPTDSPLDNNYSAQIHSLGATATARFFRLAVDQCPQVPIEFNGCALGEIAFSQVAAVPVPAALPLLGGALALFGFVAKRRRTVA